MKLNGNNRSISNYPESLIPAGVDCNPSKTCFLTPKLFIGFGLELEAEAGTNVEDIPELFGRKLCCDLTKKFICYSGGNGNMCIYLLEDFLTSSEVVGEAIVVLDMEAKTEDKSNGYGQ